MMEECSIEMPEYSLVISGEMQDGFVVIWAVVETDDPMVRKRFNLYKTGQEIKCDPVMMRYIGIAKIHVGMDLGMHIFEVFN